jgi:hypothetical protein
VSVSVPHEFLPLFLFVSFLCLPVLGLGFPAFCHDFGIGEGLILRFLFEEILSVVFGMK